MWDQARDQTRRKCPPGTCSGNASYVDLGNVPCLIMGVAAVAVEQSTCQALAFYQVGRAQRILRCCKLNFKESMHQVGGGGITNKPLGQPNILHHQVLHASLRPHIMMLQNVGTNKYTPYSFTTKMGAEGLQIVGTGLVKKSSFTTKMGAEGPNITKCWDKSVYTIPPSPPKW